MFKNSKRGVNFVIKYLTNEWPGEQHKPEDGNNRKNGWLTIHEEKKGIIVFWKNSIIHSQIENEIWINLLIEIAKLMQNVIQFAVSKW